MAEQKVDNHIYIIGIGMGDSRNMTAEVQDVIEGADLLIGAKRMLEPYTAGKRCIVSRRTEEILPWCLHPDLRAVQEYGTGAQTIEKIAVLMSGDSGFFSGAKALLAALDSEWGVDAVRDRVTVLPGISSLSYFSARIRKSWEDAAIVNLHGVQENLYQAVLTHEKVFAITGGNVQQQLRQLTEHGLGEVYGYAGENLSYSAQSAQGDTEILRERISEGTVRELAKKTYEPLTVLYLENPAAVSANLWGLPDESFVRGDVPMTKAEVRAVVMSKLRIRDKDVVYDIGAGTGSVSVEMALAARRGKLYAVESNPTAIELCKLNRDRFCLHNMEIIEGMALEVLVDLPAPDVVFIGGSRGKLPEIVEQIYDKNPAVRLVINTVTVENTANALALLESERFSGLEMVQLQVNKAKKVGTSHMMMAHNPITILSARGKGMRIQPDMED